MPQKGPEDEEEEECRDWHKIHVGNALAGILLINETMKRWWTFISEIDCFLAYSFECCFCRVSGQAASWPK